jgi:hypothetical protein
MAKTKKLGMVNFCMVIDNKYTGTYKISIKNS